MSVYGQAPGLKRARYRSSAFRAVLVSASILALAVVGIVGKVIAGESYRKFVGPGGTAAAAAAAPALIELAIARVALVVASLVMFAAWISRVVENIPALTGSYPLATPRSTIVEVLIPFFKGSLFILQSPGSAWSGAGSFRSWPVGISTCGSHSTFATRGPLTRPSSQCGR